MENVVKSTNDKEIFMKKLNNQYKTIYSCFKRINKENENKKQKYDWQLVDSLEEAKTYDEYEIVDIDTLNYHLSIGGQPFYGLVRTKEWLYYWQPILNINTTYEHDYCILGEYRILPSELN